MFNLSCGKHCERQLSLIELTVQFCTVFIDLPFQQFNSQYCTYRRSTVLYVTVVKFHIHIHAHMNLINTQYCPVTRSTYNF